MHCKKYYLLFLKSLRTKISRFFLGKCSSSLYTIHSQTNFFFQNFNQQPLSSRQEDVARTIIESQQLMLDYNATSGTPPTIPVLKKIRKYVSETVRNGEKNYCVSQNMLNDSGGNKEELQSILQATVTSANYSLFNSLYYYCY